MPGHAFIALDDVIYRPGQRPAYIGGLRDDQFAFLRARDQQTAIIGAKVDGGIAARPYDRHGPRGRCRLVSSLCRLS